MADGDNSLWKLVVGVLILLVLIAAVIVLIMSTLKDKNIGPSTGTSTTATTVTGSTEDLEGEGVDSIDGTSTATDTGTGTDTGTSTGTETGTGTGTGTSASVEKVTITYAGGAVEDFTMKTTDPPLTLKAVTVPANSEVPVVWSSSDENVFVVLQTGKVTAIGKGDATLTVTCGSVTAECTVRVR